VFAQKAEMLVAYSFTAVSAFSENTFDAITFRSASNVRTLETHGWRILVRTLPEQRDDFFYCDQNDAYLLVGDITNLGEIRTFASIYTCEALTAQPVRLIALLVKLAGPNALGLVEGPFSFLRFSGGGDVAIMVDALGLQPVHLVSGRALWITSELKAIGYADPDSLEFEEEEIVSNAQAHPDDYTPLRNGVKAKPGAVTMLRLDGDGFPSISKIPYVDYKLGLHQKVSSAHARSVIDDLLSSAISRLGTSGESIAIPLSGGLDSSLVTALAVRAGKQVSTYSIGTPVGDEFQFSRTVSTFLGTHHSELLVNENDVMEGIHDAIYCNEIFDGLSSEIQSGFSCLYKFLAGRHQRVITGYGADLLFGGVLRPGPATASVNYDLWRQIYRTRWTGEFSMFSAANSGTRVSHPFWTPRIIGFAANLSPELKVSATEVKVILRAYAEIEQLLPLEIVRRPKLGIHEGSSVNRLFANCIGVEISDYRAKTRYAYRAFRDAMTNRQQPRCGVRQINTAAR
jgi:carbapenam-3-carboxylate synthase